MRGEDAADAARLAGELGYPVSPGDLAGRLAALAAKEETAVLAAEETSGGIAGWIHVGVEAGLTRAAGAEIRALVVDSRARRAGLGRALVAAAEAWAAANGLSRIRVRTRVTREDARAFYRACGFEVEKTQEVLAKILPAADSR
jgi:GNAT superfamily N-acetyltransferase